MLEERDGDTDVLQVGYTYGDDLISQTRSGVTSYYHYDGQMSTRQLTNGSAAVTDTYTYDAFGNLLTPMGPTTNNYLYTGEQYDPNVGFYYLRARYYNQANGRFINRDPFGGSVWDPVSLHKYAYVGADPVNKLDPSGLISIAGLAAVSLGIAALIFLLANFWIIPAYMANLGGMVTINIIVNRRNLPETWNTIEIQNNVQAMLAASVGGNPVQVFVFDSAYTSDGGWSDDRRTRNHTVVIDRATGVQEWLPGGLVALARTGNGTYQTEIYLQRVNDAVKGKGGNWGHIWANILFHEVFYHGVLGQDDVGPTGEFTSGDAAMHGPLNIPNEWGEAILNGVTP